MSRATPEEPKLGMTAPPGDAETLFMPIVVLSVSAMSAHRLACRIIGLGATASGDSRDDNADLRRRRAPCFAESGHRLALQERPR